MKVDATPSRTSIMFQVQNETLIQNYNPTKQGVCCNMALPFRFKSILRQKKNYENSNISTTQKKIFKKGLLKETKILQDIITLFIVYCLQFYVHIGTKKSIRQKVDHGGQIVLWYQQHATNLAKATMFIVYMSPTRMLVWVRGRAEQKHSLTFYVFGQTRSKCFSSSTFAKSQLNKASLRMARPSTHLTLL